MMNVSAGEPFRMMVSANCFELSIGSKRAKAMCAAIRKTDEVRATQTVAARCFYLSRSSQPAAGPTNRAAAASAAGRRSAAKDGPVRSKMCDIDSV